ncbi:MAG TPA: hypothetical protein VNT79_12370 [Phycisphaerae bacterium]|nr:hypothetical protein [Phycisphaerae bacterium]
MLFKIRRDIARNRFSLHKFAAAARMAGPMHGNPCGFFPIFIDPPDAALHQEGHEFAGEMWLISAASQDV